jgi:hypothetical protein
MANDQIFQYVLISVNHQPIQQTQFQQFSKAVSDHSEKHDFAQMISQSEIILKKFSIQNIEYDGIFIPFQKERFEDLTALNWYLKTLTAKYNLIMFQLIMPDGSFIGM